MDPLISVEKKRQKIFRLYLILGGLIYGLWWFVSHYVHHNKWDPPQYRFLVGATMVSFWVLSYYSSWVKKHLEYFSFSGAIILLGHYFVLMSQNDVSITVGAGFYIPLVATAICLQSARLMAIYDIFGVVAIYITFQNVSEPKLAFSQILFGFITIMFANHVLLAARKSLEDSLKNEVNNFHQLVNSTFEGIAIVNNKVISQTNLPLENIFEASLIGEPLSKVIDLRDSNDFETVGYKGEERKPILLKVKRKKLSHRDLSQMELFSITDITLEREREAKLANTNKLAALGEVSSGIAHEINNPLALIHVSSSLLYEAIEEPQFDVNMAKKQISLIQKTVDRISKIIIALRQFSRDGSKDNFEIIPAKVLIEDVLSLCDISIKNKGVKIEKNIQDIQVFCQQIQIEQVLLNLITNAVYELNRIADRERLLKINAYQDGNMSTITIEDSGHGIPKELSDKIFQPFFTTKPVGSGSGLGLSISRGIIELHKGEIFLDTNVKNTCFVIRLPVKA